MPDDRKALSREEWIRRFALRLTRLGVGLGPDEVRDFATDQWRVAGHLSPDAVAEAEHDAGGFYPRTGDGDREPGDRLS
jgi:hypothetical protein